MTETRRDFLKFVVAGSVASGCPVNLSLLGAEGGPTPQLEGDHFAICHAVRDGQQFDKPPVSSRHVPSTKTPEGIFVPPDVDRPSAEGRQSPASA